VQAAQALSIARLMIQIARRHRRLHDNSGRDLTGRFVSCHCRDDMARAKSGLGQITSPDDSDEPVGAVGGHSDVATPRVARQSREVRQEIRIGAAPAIVFALLTDPRQMMTWFASDVVADPRAGGIFRLADFNGHWVEGIYLEVVPYRVVRFTWGGIERLRPGQSIVEFTLYPDSHGTLVRLCHSCLTDYAAEAHRFGWTKLGLPKLKAVAEGAVLESNCLDAVADLRERYGCP
jgi:uncharacterized protein YndB with AHSA1/START domain